MARQQDLEGDFTFFSCERMESIVVLRFHDNIFRDAVSLQKRDALMTFLDRLAAAEEIKVLIVESSMEKPGCQEYLDFFLRGRERWERYTIRRFCNILNHFILTIAGLNKMVIHTCRGDLIALFMNVGLVCDYRIAAENTIFCNTYLDLGMLPKGGGPLFLSRLMGKGKAYEMLLIKEEITATEALEANIVDRVVPLEELQQTAIDIAKGFSRRSARTLSGIKRLMNYTMKDLADYLEFENQEIFRIVDSPGFGVKEDKDAQPVCETR
jgi:2-(1,2-epoxy-1,2-dihydrophenyl)acetyl-CoA isomerase